MEYEDPYRQSELDVQLLNDLVDEIVLAIDTADEYYEKAIELRHAAQHRVANESDTLDENGIVSNLCVWYGSGYLIQLLGEYGICKHELKRFDCGICSRNVLIKRDADGKP